MRIKREYFRMSCGCHGKPSGWSIYFGWKGKQYRLYLHRTTGWVGEYAYREDMPRLIWKRVGGLMLITTRLEWRLDLDPVWYERTHPFVPTFQLPRDSG